MSGSLASTLTWLVALSIAAAGPDGPPPTAGASGPAKVSSDPGPAPIPIFLEPPASIDAFWARLQNPDFILLRGDHYQRLLDGRVIAPPATTEPPIVSRVVIRGEIGASAASLTIEYAVVCLDLAPRWVGLRLDGLVLGSVKERDRALAVRAAGEEWQAEVAGAGEHLIQVTLAVPVVANGEERRLDVPIPLAASTALSLLMAETPVEANLGALEPIVLGPRMGQAKVRLAAAMSPRSRVSLTWRTPLDQATALPPLLASGGEIAVDVSPDSIRTRARWSISASRGTSRSLTFRFDAAEELLELDLDGKPLPVESLVKGDTASVIIPLSEPLRQGGPPRAVSFTTRRKVGPGPAFTVGLRGFSLANASIQTGALSVAQSGSIWIDGTAGPGLRRIDPANELPDDLRSRPGTVLAYRFVEQPFVLSLKVEPAPPRVETTMRSTVTLLPGTAAIETRFNARTTPGRVFDLRFRVPAETVIEPLTANEVVESAHLATERSPERSSAPRDSSKREPGLLVVHLTSEARESGTFTVRLVTRQRWTSGEPVRLALVEPIGATSLGGRVAVLRVPGIEVDLAPEATSWKAGSEGAPRRDLAPAASDWSWPIDRSPGLEPDVLWLRYDGRPESLPLRVTARTASYRGTTNLHADVSRQRIDYRQSVRMEVVDGQLNEFELTIPRAVDDDWAIDGIEIASRVLTGTDPDGSRRYRLVPGKGPLRSMALLLRFRSVFPTSLAPDRPRDDRFSMIRIAPDPTGPVHFSYTVEPSISLALDPGGWETRLVGPSPLTIGDDSTAVSALVSSTPGAPLPRYTATAGSVVPLPALVVGRAYFRTVRGSEEQRTTATFRLDVHGPTIEVSLPPDARWLQARLDGETISTLVAVAGKASVRIPLPTGGGRSKRLVVEYSTATGSSGSWQPPRLTDAVVLSTDWIVIVPESQAILGVPRGWFDQNHWSWDRYVWIRKPRVGQGEPFGTNDDGSRDDGALAGRLSNVHGYLFGRVEGLADIPVVIVARSMLVGVCSGTIGLIGIGLILLRERARRLVLVVVALLALGCLAWDSNLTFQIVQSGALGLLLTAIAAVLQWRVNRRAISRRRFADPTGSISPALGLGLEHDGAVGSDDSTAIRARPATTADRIVIPVPEHAPSLGERHASGSGLAP